MANGLDKIHRKAEELCKAIVSENHRVCGLSDSMTRGLESRVGSFINAAQVSIEPKPYNSRFFYLLRTLEKAVFGILKMKDTLFRLRIVFGLVSRLYFEARGCVDYHTIYRPLLDSDYEQDVNPNLVGVLTDGSYVCEKYQHMEIPVWHARTRAQASSARLVERTKPRLYQSRPLCQPQDCFRDDGISREETGVSVQVSDLTLWCDTLSDLNLAVMS